MTHATHATNKQDNTTYMTATALATDTDTHADTETATDTDSYSCPQRLQLMHLASKCKCGSFFSIYQTHL